MKRTLQDIIAERNAIAEARRAEAEAESRMENLRRHCNRWWRDSPADEPEEFFHWALEWFQANQHASWWTRGDRRSRIAIDYAREDRRQRGLNPYSGDEAIALDSMTADEVDFLLPPAMIADDPAEAIELRRAEAEAAQRAARRAEATMIEARDTAEATRNYSAKLWAEAEAEPTNRAAESRARRAAEDIGPSRRAARRAEAIYCRAAEAAQRAAEAVLEAEAEAEADTAEPMADGPAMTAEAKKKFIGRFRPEVAFKEAVTEALRAAEPTTRRAWVLSEGGMIAEDISSLLGHGLTERGVLLRIAEARGRIKSALLDYGLHFAEAGRGRGREISRYREDNDHSARVNAALIADAGPAAEWHSMTWDDLFESFDRRWRMEPELPAELPIIRHSQATFIPRESVLSPMCESHTRAPETAKMEERGLPAPYPSDTADEWRGRQEAERRYRMIAHSQGGAK